MPHSPSAPVIRTEFGVTSNPSPSTIEKHRSLTNYASSWRSTASSTIPNIWSSPRFCHPSGFNKRPVDYPSKTAKNRKIEVPNFCPSSRGFSKTVCSPFLCVFAPLREHFPFWEWDSRKAAKAQRFPEGPAITRFVFSPRNHVFGPLLCSAISFSEHPLKGRRQSPTPIQTEPLPRIARTETGPMGPIGPMEPMTRGYGLASVSQIRIRGGHILESRSRGRKFGVSNTVESGFLSLVRMILGI